MKAPYRFVIATIPEDPQACEAIIHGLLKQELAACVSVLGPVKSRYWWEGNIETASELILLIKTKTALFPDVQQFIKRHHPYKVPEIVALEIVDGNQDYLTWIGSVCRYSPRMTKEAHELRTKQS